MFGNDSVPSLTVGGPLAMTAKQQAIRDRVHKEPDKLRQVTHWDIDYLSLTEIDSLYRQNQANSPPHLTIKPTRDSTARLPLILIAAGLVVLLLSLSIASRL
jgi:hypothetical protein